MLVKDDIVHRFGKVNVDFVQEGCSVSGRLSSQGFGGLGHGEDAIHLVVVHFGDLMARHVLNVVIVLDERVSVHTILVRTFETLNELLWILFVKNDEDSGKTALFLGNFPISLKALTFGQILEQTQFAPVAKLVLVLPETVRANSFLREGAFTALAKPVLGQARVIRLIVVCFEGQPAAWDFLGVSELSSSLN